jgi:hypothetical protein
MVPGSPTFGPLPGASLALSGGNAGFSVIAAAVARHPAP